MFTIFGFYKFQKINNLKKDSIGLDKIRAKDYEEALNLVNNDEILNEVSQSILSDIESSRQIPELEHYFDPMKFDNDGFYHYSDGTKKQILGESVKIPNQSENDVFEEVLMVEFFDNEECPHCNTIIPQGVILLTESCSIMPAKCCNNSIYFFEEEDSMTEWE